MAYLLTIDEEPCGQFAALEGLAGELPTLAGGRGPFLSFSDGRLEGSLRRWAASQDRGVANRGVGEVRVFADGGPSPCGVHLGAIQPIIAFGADPDGSVDEVVLRAPQLVPVPQHAQEFWHDWTRRPPLAKERWVGLTTPQRRALLWVSRMVSEPGHRGVLPERWVIDGRTVLDAPSLFLAIGEALAGPGGYVGADLDGLSDCLIDWDMPAEGSTLTWDCETYARKALDREQWRREVWRLGFDDPPGNCLLSAVNAVLENRGVLVTPKPG